MMLKTILWNLKNLSNKICYINEEGEHTYRELYKYVANLIVFLKNNCKNKSPILVYGHKEFFMPVSFLACSFCGIPYVPVDVSMPMSRINSIIEQVNPQMIIGNLGIGDLGIKNLSIENLNSIFNLDDENNIEKIEMKKDDIYYIIFTSGSTGEPKGVKVSYSNIDSCIKWLNELILPSEEVILNQGLFSFDLSVADLYLSLVSGSTHYILEKSTQSDYQKLFNKLEQSKATIAVMTPSFAEVLLKSNKFSRYLMSDLTKIIFCGESLKVEIVKQLFERFPHTHFINAYGPTEATFAVTSIEITREMLEQKVLPIGIPKKDVDIYIVDEKLKEKPFEEVGEILIAGKSVAIGYVKDVKNKNFIKYKGKNAYLTGDLGYKNGENYFCCGRKDRQIKLHGYRVELSDIENSIETIEGVEKCIVVPKYNSDVVERIYSFIKLKQNVNITEYELLKEIKKFIPNYIIPSIVIVEDFPLTCNGKCDEKRLLENV